MHPGSTAAVVDTTGNFDILRLYALILSRLQTHDEVFASVRAAVGGEDVEDVARTVLDGVKIMRVFDFVGVKEAVGEVRGGVEGSGVGGVDGEDAKAKEGERKAPTPSPLTPEPLQKEPLPKRTVVADSEDEDEEMLFDTSAPAASPAPAVQNAAPRPTSPSREPPTPTANPPINKPNFKFLLIDSLSQTLAPLVKSSPLQPLPALVSSFLISLAHLTRTHGLYTLLATTTIVPKPGNPARPANPPNPTRPASPTRQQEPVPPPSIFASNTAVPSLMGVLARYVDMQVLVGDVPREGKGRGKGEVWRRKGKGKGVDMVCVIEVLGERWEGSGAGWGVFEPIAT
jgi:hypothetical protein